MRFVDDDRVVGREHRIALRFRQKDAVGHELDRGARRCVVRKADLVAHHVARRRPKLFGDARGN